ncbi:MAG: YitT family protein [Bacteroidales bacterium]|nr:YitT family protein [Bacteroidales bacterium]
MKESTKKIVFDFTKIIIGAVLQATAYVLFISPHKIVPGGIYGITIIIHHLTEGVFSFAPEGLPMGAMALCFNIPIMLIATRVLGFKSGGKTVVTFLSIAVFTDVLTAITKESIIVDDALLSCFYGGVILGIGVFLTLSANSTSAGSDVIARIVSMKLKVKLSYMIIIIDSIIVLLGLVAFKDISIPLYSWFTIFIYGQTVDILLGKNPNCLMFIVCDNMEKVKDFIINEMHRSGTYFDANGLYTDKEKKMIMMVVAKREAMAVENRIKAFDENIFIVTTDAHDIHGNGYIPVPHWKYRKYR